MDASSRQEEFGRRVRRRRMALGMIQKTLAERVDMPQGHISRIEKGEFLSMNLEKLVVLADVLETTTDYLLGRSNEAGEVPEKRIAVSRTRRRPVETPDFASETPLPEDNTLQEAGLVPCVV